MTESKIKREYFRYRGYVPNGTSVMSLIDGTYEVDSSHKVSQGVPTGCNENGKIISFSDNGYALYIDLFGNIATFNRYSNTWNTKLATT